MIFKTTVRTQLEVQLRDAQHVCLFTLRMECRRKYVGPTLIARDILMIMYRLYLLFLDSWSCWRQT